MIVIVTLAELGEEWKKLAHYLSVRRIRIQAIMRNNVNKENENAIYDMLLTWAKKVPRSVNKVYIRTLWNFKRTPP